VRMPPRPPPPPPPPPPRASAWQRGRALWRCSVDPQGPGEAALALGPQAAPVQLAVGFSKLRKR
jgi:hypothetical protein